jgi:nicotinamide-nucleotide amidase
VGYGARAVRAEILTIGDELCRGEIVDTNSAYLAGRLWDLGITTRWMTSCNDVDEDLVTAVRQAVARADVVVCSGGLGPTEDDLTVDVLARLAGTEPVIDDPSRARMEAWFAGRVAVTPIQLRQVRVPAGARVFENPVGLAPGFEVAIAGVPVVCVPGFPRELHAIWERALGTRLAELREACGERERIARRIYRVFGRGESQISQACRGLIDEIPGATIHYQVKFPETLVKLVVRAPKADIAEARLGELDGQIRQRLAPYLYGAGDESLVERAMRRLLAAGQTVATAESCTGGMIGEMLTRTPGSSAAYRGGAIVYANEEKTRQLGVAPATLEAHGAVSEPVVIEMARGCVERFGVDHAVAVSGVAGPGGGTADKPVGTVWLALASRAGRIATRTLAWPSTRDQIRTLAAWWAIAMLDAAVPSTDPAELARARWILEGERAP